MNIEHRVLNERQGWDSVYTADYYIKRALFAVMTKDERVRTVCLCFSEENGLWKYTSLQYYRGDGLHYAGNGSFGKTFLKRRVTGGSTEITARWPVCERFLVPDDLEWRKAFMRLPMQKRKDVLKEQAERLASHYKNLS